MDGLSLSAHAPIFTPSSSGLPEGQFGARRRGGEGHLQNEFRSGRGRQQAPEDCNGPPGTSEPAQGNRDPQGQRGRSRPQRAEHDSSLNTYSMSTPNFQTGGSPANSSTSRPANGRTRGGGRGRGRGRDHQQGRYGSGGGHADAYGPAYATNEWAANALLEQDPLPGPAVPPGHRQVQDRSNEHAEHSGRGPPPPRRTHNQRAPGAMHADGPDRQPQWDSAMEAPGSDVGYEGSGFGFGSGSGTTPGRGGAGGEPPAGRGGRGPERGGRGGSRGRFARGRGRSFAPGFHGEQALNHAAAPPPPSGRLLMAAGFGAVQEEQHELQQQQQPRPRPTPQPPPQQQRQPPPSLLPPRQQQQLHQQQPQQQPQPTVGGRLHGRPNEDVNGVVSPGRGRRARPTRGRADGLPSWRGAAPPADGAGADFADAAADAAAASAAPGGCGSDSDSDGETLTCVICCEEVTAVAMGACGHSHTCAKCCLRLRLCYRDLRCPLCKAVNKEVVVARPPLPPGATFDSLAEAPQQREQLWQSPKWAKGVLVYDPPQPAPKPGHRRRPLHKSLLAMTSRSCAVCDAHGRHPFGTMNLLLGHLRSAHDRTLCDVCLGAGLRFPLEYPAYSSDGLAAHMAAEHPRCEYCDLAFYGKDELYSHMTQRHFTCHVCSRMGRHHLYFPDADTLLVHLREEHHTCDHQDCFGCMIAFASRDELITHIRDRHSSHMPRWDQARARPLLLDIITPRGPAAAAALAAAGSESRTHRRGRGNAAAAGAGGSTSSQPRRARPDGLQDLEAFPSLQSLGPAHPQPQQQQAGLGDLRDAEGGLAVIDDDLGLGPGSGSRGSTGPGGGAVGAREGGAAASGAGPGPGSGPGTGTAMLAGAWAGRTPGSRTFREDFPELSSAAGGAAPGAGGGRTAWGASQASESGAGPGGWTTPGAGMAAPSAAAVLALRKVTVRCPCGNRVDHLALRPDEKPPQLSCARECVAKQRRAQLADAFGVEVADNHVSYFDRHRTPNYTAELLLAAQAAGPEWVASLERDLARFLADSSARRTALQPGMSQAQRKLVHELAGHYGLASHSVGQGATRAVQLLKSAASGVPTRLLSVVAAATPPEELARTAGGGGGGGGGWVLRLVDVSPGADVEHYLQAWHGDYTLTAAAGSGASAYQLTFAREAPFRDCCNRLGGGIRGVFRTVVDRERQPPPAAAAAPPTAAAVITAALSKAPQPPPPAATPPAGWQVLRGKASAPAAAAAARRGATGVGAAAGDTAAAVRAALAADAWASDDDDGDRPARLLQSSLVPLRQQHQQPAEALPAPGGGWLGGGVMAAAVAAAVELQVPGRGPPLDLAEETLWSALAAAEELEENAAVEEAKGDDEGHNRGDEGAKQAEGEWREEGSSDGADSRAPHAAAAADTSARGEAQEEGVVTWEDAV